MHVGSLRPFGAPIDLVRDALIRGEPGAFTHGRRKEPERMFPIVRVDASDFGCGVERRNPALAWIHFTSPALALEMAAAMSGCECQPWVPTLDPGNPAGNLSSGETIQLDKAVDPGNLIAEAKACSTRIVTMPTGSRSGFAR
jgi:hypothetical protein